MLQSSDERILPSWEYMTAAPAPVRNRHTPRVTIEDSPGRMAFVIRTGLATIVLPYRCAEQCRTYVVPDYSDPYRERHTHPEPCAYPMPEQVAHALSESAELELKKTKKPQEKNDLCSTHIYTRK